MQKKHLALLVKVRIQNTLEKGTCIQVSKTAKKQYAEWFSDPNALKQKVIIDPIYNEVLTENLVLTTVIGAVTKVDPDNPDQEPWIIGYTMLWKKEDVGWRIINMHNSWE